MDSDVFDTSATRAGLVYDVTHTDFWAQNGSSDGRVLATFKRRILNKQQQKLTEKLLYVSLN